ncbi:hypothetical protein [Wolbachia endosymbiont of Drosophila tsacasi]|nr:hypothetical protein [Wolbachia endosymbiont of Drosophila tsacasi]MDE5062481.1 hypothetical protein [Wolbachia endosymbiont of Drosophila tsacasi]
MTLESRKKEPVSGHWDDKKGATRMTRKEHCHYRVNQCQALA